MTRRFVLATVALGLCGLLASSYPAFAETKDNMKARLRADLVTEKDGRFTIERVRICQLVRPKELGGGATRPFQVRARVEAPADGVISRDNFVALFTEIALSLRVKFAGDLIKGLGPVQALGALRCKPIDAPIGAVDFEADVHMTKDGVQIEMMETASGKRQRQTVTWDRY